MAPRKSKKSAPVRQSIRKRVHEDKSPSPNEEITKDSPPKDNTMVVWTRTDLDKLINVLKTEGFHGDYAELHKHFPNVPSRSLQYLFDELCKPTPAETNKSITTPSRKRNKKRDLDLSDEPASHRGISLEFLEKWMDLLADNNETQRLGSNLSNVIDYIAKFEEHPDPKTCGVDYAAIYSYIATLSKGHIPKQLDPASAKKLLHMMQVLKRSILKAAPDSQKLLLEHAKLPFYNPRTEAEEKNRILRERRRATWSEDELKEADLLKTGDLQAIKSRLCDKPGLNPFCLPPTL